MGSTPLKWHIFFEYHDFFKVCIIILYILFWISVQNLKSFQSFFKWFFTHLNVGLKCWILWFLHGNEKFEFFAIVISSMMYLFMFVYSILQTETI